MQLGLFGRFGICCDNNSVVKFVNPAQFYEVHAKFEDFLIFRRSESCVSG